MNDLALAFESLEKQVKSKEAAMESDFLHALTKLIFASFLVTSILYFVLVKYNFLSSSEAAFVLCIALAIYLIYKIRMINPFSFPVESSLMDEVYRYKFNDPVAFADFKIKTENGKMPSYRDFCQLINKERVRINVMKMNEGKA